MISFIWTLLLFKQQQQKKKGVLKKAGIYWPPFLAHKLILKAIPKLFSTNVLSKGSISGIRSFPSLRELIHSFIQPSIHSTNIYWHVPGIMLETEVEWAYLPKAYGIIQRKIKKEAVMIECAKYHNDVCTMYEWSLSETYLIQPGGWIRGGRRSRKPSTQWWCLHCPERWLGISQEKI